LPVVLAKETRPSTTSLNASTRPIAKVRPMSRDGAGRVDYWNPSRGRIRRTSARKRHTGRSFARIRSSNVFE
jgi:hypothetical protein